jgi:hypothetical protein
LKTASEGDDAYEELIAVHALIVELQRSLRAQRLDGLVNYVSALRERVEEHLA